MKSYKIGTFDKRYPDPVTSYSISGSFMSNNVLHIKFESIFTQHNCEYTVYNMKALNWGIGLIILSHYTSEQLRDKSLAKPGSGRV